MQLTLPEAPATPTRAPVLPHRRSAAGTRTPNTPPQTTAPRRVLEDSGSSPPKPVAGSARLPYRRPNAAPPHSSPAAAPQPDKAPQPRHPSQRPLLAWAAG